MQITELYFRQASLDNPVWLLEVFYMIHTYYSLMGNSLCTLLLKII